MGDGALMALRSFDNLNSVEARQALLDRRCERTHPKRHRTKRRSVKRSAGKRSKARHVAAVRKHERGEFLDASRAYWRGERESHP
jgi:hypothetical protein